MVLISFFDGHQVPAAIRDSFPGLTSVKRQKKVRTVSVRQGPLGDAYSF